MPGTEQAAASPAATARVDEILRAACRVVVAGGASDLRIGSVAQEAGVSRTLVHYYFTTRQELLRATFAYAEDLRIVALDAELATLATGAERAERALFRTIDPELEETPALWNEVWSSLRYDEELRPLVQERYRAWADRIVRLLDEGRDGRLRSAPRSTRRARAGGSPRLQTGSTRSSTSACSTATGRARSSRRASGGSSRRDAPLAVGRPRGREEDVRRRCRRRRRLAGDRQRRVLLAARPIRAAARRRRFG